MPRHEISFNDSPRERLTGTPSAADLTAIGNSTPDGFTGHEMLDGVGLIHMNGRVYDPTVGRFLSVDPIVRDAGASQSWNGYGYVEGRTLSWTDPSGYDAKQLTSTGNVQPVNPPPPPPIPSNPSYRITHHFHDIEIVFRTTGDFMRMSGGRGNAASFGTVNEAQEVDREPQAPSEDVEAPPSVGPIPPPRLPCETDVATLVNLTGTVVEPLVDLNIAVLATQTDRLSRAAARGFAYVGVGFALNDIYSGWDEGNNTRVAWGRPGPRCVRGFN